MNPLGITFYCANLTAQYPSNQGLACLIAYILAEAQASSPRPKSQAGIKYSEILSQKISSEPHELFA
jgi:hypothetical protein